MDEVPPPPHRKAVLTLLADPKSLDVDPAYAPLARAFIQNAGPDGVLHLLHRYGVAISRSYLRHLRELQRLRPDAFAAPNGAATVGPNGTARIEHLVFPARAPVRSVPFARFYARTAPLSPFSKLHRRHFR